VHYREVAELPLFPLIGPAVSALPVPDAPAGNPYLPPITDATYTWR
jgi:8-oxo-dGTP diphosphatase